MSTNVRRLRLHLTFGKGATAERRRLSVVMPQTVFTSQTQTIIWFVWTQTRCWGQISWSPEYKVQPPELPLALINKCSCSPSSASTLRAHDANQNRLRLNQIFRAGLVSFLFSSSSYRPAWRALRVGVVWVDYRVAGGCGDGNRQLAIRDLTSFLY